MEEELGVPIFERLGRGVRLTTAGEILIDHIRGQITDMARVKSQIADLSGERRGHVSIACSQALLPYFLPKQIATYRGEHPAVTFGVLLRDRASAEQALVDFSADLVLVFEPIRMLEFQNLLNIRQPLHAVMTATPSCKPRNCSAARVPAISCGPTDGELRCAASTGSGGAPNIAKPRSGGGFGQLRVSS